jgi:extradiol dioxygenase family protein
MAIFNHVQIKVKDLEKSRKFYILPDIIAAWQVISGMQAA